MCPHVNTLGLFIAENNTDECGMHVCAPRAPQKYGNIDTKILILKYGNIDTKNHFADTKNWVNINITMVMQGSIGHNIDPLGVIGVNWS